MGVLDTVQFRGKVQYCDASAKGEVYATVVDAADDAGQYPVTVNLKLPVGSPLWKVGQIGDFVLSGTRSQFRDPKRGMKETLNVQSEKVSWYTVRLEPVKETAK